MGLSNKYWLGRWIAESVYVQTDTFAILQDVIRVFKPYTLTMSRVFASRLTALISLSTWPSHSLECSQSIHIEAGRQGYPHRNSFSPAVLMPALAICWFEGKMRRAGFQVMSIYWYVLIFAMPDASDCGMGTSLAQFCLAKGLTDLVKHCVRANSSFA